MPDRIYRRPKRPALFWTVFGLITVIAGSSVAFLALYS